MLGQVYYALDLLLAVSYPVAVVVGVRLGWLPASARSLFLLGALLGMAWEVPIFALSAWSGTPMIAWPTPLPAHPLVFIFAHSSWDGALLLGGFMLADRLAPGGALSAAGVGIQLLWGQVTELCVEISAITANTWVYLDDVWFNPVLFHFMGHPVTLGLQVVWFLAPLAFVGLVRALSLVEPEGGAPSD